MPAETHSSATTAVAVVDPVFTDSERYALAAFLAGYGGLTRDAYSLDLRQFITAATRTACGCSRCVELTSSATPAISRSGDALGRRSPAGCAPSPASTVTPRRKACWDDPQLRMCVGHGSTTKSHATGLDRNEVGALLVAAGLASAREHALISLLAINGLRVSEALGTDIEALGTERGHRTLTVLRKGGKVVTIPLAPRTARPIDLAIGERLEGPVFFGGNGERLDRHAAWRIVRRLARKAGITSRSVRTPFAMRSSPRHSTLACRFRDVQEAASHADPRTTMRYDRARVSLDRHATYIVAAFLAGAAR